MSTASQLMPTAAMPSALPTFGLPVAAPNATATLSPERLSALENYAHTAPQSWLELHASWLTHTFAAFFLFSAVLLIALLAVQTTKQESLGGSMSGRAEAYRPRLGLDGQLAKATEVVAIFFVIFATFVSLTGI